MTHHLTILSIGSHPAATCSCSKWGYTFTDVPGDTSKMKLDRLEEGFREHLADVRKERAWQGKGRKK